MLFEKDRHNEESHECLVVDRKFSCCRTEREVNFSILTKLS